jgi:lipoic acid synthetase
MSKRPYPHRRFPQWLKKPVIITGGYRTVTSCISGNRLHTVCTEGRCPNRSECFSAGTAAFLIMGNICTRRCGFCGVRHGNPVQPDHEEPERIACAAKALNLRHIVITSVSRDDLIDGGAACFAETVRQCRNIMTESTIEILIPDFRGKPDALETVVACRPDILNHNLETVPRLYEKIRPQADYQRSLDLLAYAGRKGIATKSGIMVGLGETNEEIIGVLMNLHAAGCRIVTIGQYLQPSKEQVPVHHYVSPEQFTNWEKTGRTIGFRSVFAGSFVRSSYRSQEVFNNSRQHRSINGA